jgi:hypothetical protein
MPATPLGHAFDEAVDDRRIGQVFAVRVDPEGGWHGDSALKCLDQLDLAQAAGFDNSFGGLHTQHHGCGDAIPATRLPGEIERHLQLRGSTRQPPWRGNLKILDVLGAQQLLQA